MRKSNWSDLLSALAISERDNVRRLLESAMMKALAVISEINTTVVASVRQQPLVRRRENDVLSQALQNRMGAVHAFKGRIRWNDMVHTICCNHLDINGSNRLERSRQCFLL